MRKLLYMGFFEQEFELNGVQLIVHFIGENIALFKSLNEQDFSQLASWASQYLRELIFFMILSFIFDNKSSQIKKQMKNLS